MLHLVSLHITYAICRSLTWLVRLDAEYGMEGVLSEHWHVDTHTGPLDGYRSYNSIRTINSTVMSNVLSHHLWRLAHIKFICCLEKRVILLLFVSKI